MRIICILAVLLAAIFAAAYLIPFYNPIPRRQTPYDLPTGEQYDPYHDRMHTLVTRLSSKPCEQVFITARDGARLAARYYHASDDAAVKIEFHGYRGTSIRDFCGAIEIDELCGYNVLLVDQRAHGLSDGRTIGFGVLERHDVADWCNYAVERFGEDVKIILSGVSMGGATVLMASDLDLPPNVRGIIADCAYSSPAAIIKKVCREDFHLPVWLMYPFIRLAAGTLGGFDLESASAVESVKHAKVPIILFHGGDDRYVPRSMAEEIFAAADGKAQLHIMEGAGHAMSYLTEQERYHALAIPFFEDCLKD